MKTTYPTALAAVLFATMFCAAVAPTNAAAQSRAALVQNVDEPGRSPYEEFVSANPFNGPQFKTVTFTFSPVPAGMRLVLLHLNANVVGTGGTTPYSTISRGSGVKGIQYFPVARAYADPFSTRYEVNTDTLSFFDAGERPTVTLEMDFVADTFGFGNGATLSGYYIKLP